MSIRKMKLVDQTSINQEEFSKQWVEITPKGYRRNRKNFKEHVEELKKNIGQVLFLVRFNVNRRSFGMVFGNLWLIGEPILYAVLYYFLINIVLRVKGDDVRFLFIFTSVTFWRVHAKMFNGSPSIIMNRAGILRQTNFPIQLIFYEYILTDLVLLGYKVLVLFAFLLFNGIMPKATWLLLPFVFTVQLTFSMLFVIVFSSLGIFFKDLSRMLFVFVSIWWYLSPGMYGVSRIPEAYQSYYMINPFAHILPAYHNVLLHGRVPDFWPLFPIFLLSFIGVILCIKFLNYSRYYFFKYL